VDKKTQSANLAHAPVDMDAVRAAILREASGGLKVEEIADARPGPFRDPYAIPATRTKRTAGEARKRKRQRKQSTASRKRNTRSQKPKKRRKKR
jgi:hypothetical protein